MEILGFHWASSAVNYDDYSAFDKELLGLYLAVRHFRFFLEGRYFTVFTDHKSLTFAMSKTSEPWTARQTRHLSYISEFTTDIQHVSGKDNPADALSRVIIAPILEGIDYACMAEEQLKDEEIPAYRISITGLRFEYVAVPNSSHTFLCVVSLGYPRPVISFSFHFFFSVVPSSMRRRVYDILHDLSHPGVNVTVKVVSSKVVWHGLAKQAVSYTHLTLPTTSRV